MKRRTLEKTRSRILREIRSLGPVFRGSLAEVHLTCGKKNCRCQKGHRHRAFYVSYRCEGQTKVFHVPAHLLEEARQFHGNWLRLKELLQQLADGQVALWKEVCREQREASRKRKAGRGKRRGKSTRKS